MPPATDQAVITRILKLRARGWTPTAIASDVQVSRQTVWAILRKHEAAAVAAQIATSEIVALRKVIANLYLGTCAHCKGPLVAFRSQGVSSCPRCRFSFDAALAST